MSSSSSIERAVFRDESGALALKTKYLLAALIEASLGSYWYGKGLLEIPRGLRVTEGVNSKEKEGRKG